MNNKPVQRSNIYEKVKKLLIIALCCTIIPSFASPQNDEVLLTVADRVISTSEFLYHYKKSFHEPSNRDLDTFLGQFIDYHLKLADARNEGLGRNLAFIAELTEYRTKLAAPYLYSKEKEEILTREAYERLFYEVSASHILVGVNPESKPEDTLKAYKKAMQLRESIVGGKAFDQVAKSFSDDIDVAINSGNLGYFTAFKFEYPFENAVFKLNPGELSKPIRTSYGYQLILCKNKRLIDNHNLPPYEQKKEEIRQWINDPKDVRAEIIKNAFTLELKKEWNFTENRAVLDSLYTIADDKIFTGDWKMPASLIPETVLCSIDCKDLILSDFVEFISGHETKAGKYSVKEYVNLLYDQFVSDRLIKYENYKLEEKYPEFRYQYWDYRDAMQLLEITRKRVWEKLTSEARGAVLGDSQSSLMHQWIEDLRNRYKVQINRDVLFSIRKALSEQEFK